MRYYWLAWLIWLAIIAMFASVLLIPVCMYLRDRFVWFRYPFAMANDERHWREGEEY